MGSPFKIVIYCNDSMHAVHLAKQSFKLIEDYVNIFSDYIDSSEMMKLTSSAKIKSQPVKVSDELLELLLKSKFAYEKSRGTFDITIGPIVKLWRKARKQQQFPANNLVQKMRKLSGFDNILIDSINKEITILKQGMQLDFGGIAQGYIAQKVIDFLSDQQVTSALVNASGDIVMSGAPPDNLGWTIGVNYPESENEILQKTLLIKNKAVTTSGDAFQFMEHNGKKYSHIIDPRSGYGITSKKNVTVIANDGTTADWLTKACTILSIKKAKKLAVQLGAEVLITQIKKGKIIYYSTKGFAQYWK